jgi:hypothetical protein
MRVKPGQPKMIRMTLDADQDVDDARVRMVKKMREKFPGAKSITFRTIKGVCEVFARGGADQRDLTVDDEADFEAESDKVKKKPKKEKKQDDE